ncbi:ROK family transcriptional regulator [Dysgonomonas sp. 521]|uniref:ROK family transcriptional regulator n=1 Tax=Dysgonomonas sp. 521 TaxID=2302932 RepID=UPI0013D4C7B8|nr:ROK family transcriptional regulator [Dysgonomonas sp. 521]NDV97455.1 ROK family transcriptional regulator [Dysgonomonas sp. 521]
MNTQLLQEIEKGTKSALIKKNIINYYIQSGSSTITELSKKLDLSIPTVTKFISEMCEDGYINDYGKLETTGGRYPNLYGLNPESGYFIGVDIKQSAINIGLINFKGDIVDLKMGIPYKMQNTPEAMNRLCELILSFIDKQSVNKDKILNINVNISGRVNPEAGYSYSIFYFEERPLAEILSEKLNGYKVTIDNDTRAMTYGEYLSGCVNNEKNIIFVNISWGLAIGIIIDGKVYTGKSGFAGEFGHMKIYDNEILCHCGKKGCLETEASGSAMYRRLFEQIHNGASSLLSKKVKKEEVVTLDEIIEAVNKEDVLCIDLVEEIGQKLGEQIAGLINIFNPEMVIIGGTVSMTEDYIMEPVKTAIRKYSLNLVNKDSTITVSKLKDRAGVIGACLLARTRLFEIH